MGADADIKTGQELDQLYVFFDANGNEKPFYARLPGSFFVGAKEVKDASLVAKLNKAYDDLRDGLESGRIAMDRPVVYGSDDIAEVISSKGTEGLALRANRAAAWAVAVFCAGVGGYAADKLPLVALVNFGAAGLNVYQATRPLKKDGDCN